MPLGYRRENNRGKEGKDRCPVRKVTQSFLSNIQGSLPHLYPHPSVPSPVLLSLSHPRAQSQTATRKYIQSHLRGAVVTKSSMPKLQVHNCTNSKIKQVSSIWAGVTAMWEALSVQSERALLLATPPDVMQMSNLTGTQPPCCQPKPRLPVAATTLKNRVYQVLLFPTLDDLHSSLNLQVP